MYFKLALLATVGGFLFGYDTSNIGSALNFVPYGLHVFPVWQSKISLAGVLVCLSGLAILAIVFVWKFLPETKGLSVEDIVQLFEPHQPPAPSAEPVTAVH